jgi:hypothetical protein
MLLKPPTICHAYHFYVRKLNERDSSRFHIQADGITFCFVWFKVSVFVSLLHVVVAKREDAGENWNKLHN